MLAGFPVPLDSPDSLKANTTAARRRIHMPIVTCVGDYELTLLKAVLEDDEELTA